MTRRKLIYSTNLCQNMHFQKNIVKKYFKKIYKCFTKNIFVSAGYCFYNVGSTMGVFRYQLFAKIQHKKRSMPSKLL